MNVNVPKCKHCKIAFDNEGRKPITIVCGDTLCEQCYDSSLLEDGKRIKCPIDGNTFHLIGTKLYDIEILQKLMIQKDYQVFCDTHGLEPADYYEKEKDKLICQKCMSQGGYDTDQVQFIGKANLAQLGDMLHFSLEAFLNPFKLIQTQLNGLKQHRKEFISAKRMMEIVRMSEDLLSRSAWNIDFIDKFGFKQERKVINHERSKPQLIEEEEVKHIHEDHQRQLQELTFQYESQLQIADEQTKNIVSQQDQEIQELQRQIERIASEKDYEIQRLQQDLQMSNIKISELNEECDMLEHKLTSKNNDNEAFQTEMKSDLERRIRDLESMNKLMDQELEEKDLTNRKLIEQVEKLQYQMFEDLKKQAAEKSQVKQPQQVAQKSQASQTQQEEITAPNEEKRKLNNQIICLQDQNQILIAELNDLNFKLRDLVTLKFHVEEEMNDEIEKRNDEIKKLNDEIKKDRKEMDLLQTELCLSYGLMTDQQK